MLALRSDGIVLSELLKYFGSEWLNKNNEKLAKLTHNGFLQTDSDKIKFTAKGYSLCDEILLQLI